jgi:pimeloyl-ACP methyl ester carboxylesterase
VGAFAEEMHFREAPRYLSDAPQPDRLGVLGCLSRSGFHRIAYTDWGPEGAAEIVVCVHGLTRQGRDFDYLAYSLANAGLRVVCPDLVGRGKSGWMPHVLDYVFPQYCADMATLLATLGSAKVHWVGTSLGGLIGIVLASMMDSPIATLVVNDIGPSVPTTAVARVGGRINSFPTAFSSLEQAERFNRRAFAACGDLTDAQWRHFTLHSVRKDEERGYVARLDPKVVTAYNWLFYYQMGLWSYWDQLKIRILAIHGEESDFMPPYLIDAMKRRAPQLETVPIAGVGHMPMLMSAGEIGAVRAFLQTQARA